MSRESSWEVEDITKMKEIADTFRSYAKDLVQSCDNYKEEVDKEGNAKLSKNAEEITNLSKEGLKVLLEAAAETADNAATAITKVLQSTGNL